MFKWPLFRKHEWEHTIYRLPKTAILSFLDLCSLTCWWYVKSDDIQAKNSKRAFECFFRGLLVIIDSEIVAHFWRNTFPKTSYSLMTFGDLKINLSEKMTGGTFQCTPWEQWNAVFPVFLSLLVFELADVVILTPLTGAKVAGKHHPGAD